MMYYYLEQDAVLQATWHILLEEKQMLLLGKFGTHYPTGQDNVSPTLPDFTAKSDPMVWCLEEQ